MKNKNEKTVGILGGYGPLATSLFFNQIIQKTQTESDKDHLHIIVDCNPKIPSRARAYLFDEESPISYMIESLENMKDAGCDFFVCPCNSAHYFLRNAVLPIPMLDMISSTVTDICNSGKKKVVLIGSEVTIGSQMYQKEASEYKDIEIVSHGNLEEMRFIIEAGKTQKNLEKAKYLLRQIISHYKHKGFDGIIYGCTEFPLVLDSKESELYVFDTVEILSRKTVEYAKK